MKLNEKIIRNYLTPVQIKRLNIFTRMFQADAKPADVKTMLVKSKLFLYFDFKLF